MEKAAGLKVHKAANKKVPAEAGTDTPITPGGPRLAQSPGDKGKTLSSLHFWSSSFVDVFHRSQNQCGPGTGDLKVAPTTSIIQKLR